MAGALRLPSLLSYGVIVPFEARNDITIML